MNENDQQEHGEDIGDTDGITTENVRIEVLPKKAEKVGVYTGRFGGKSTQVAAATVEYAGLTLDCIIWKRLSIDRNDGSETLTTEPGLPSGIKIEDEAFLGQFKAYIMASMAVWFGYAAADEKARQRLLNPTTVTASSGSKVVELVKR